MARPLASLIFRDTLSKALFSNFSPIVTKFRLNSTFEAACLREYGKPLVIDKFTRQPLNPGHVRVAVEYCSLNFNDVKYLEETYSDKTLPFIPGYELSGEILEVGEGCEDSNFTVGQRVVGVIKSGHGGIATEAVLKANSVWELPAEIPYPDAAAVVCGHATAMLAFTQFSPLNEGDILLVIAGAGGYGLAAVDVAASIFKSKVIAVVDTDGEGSLLRDRGAFAAFKNNLKRNYKEIMKASDDKGVHHIYDAVGGPILNTVIKCITDPTKGLVLGTYRLRKEHIAPEEKKSEEADSDSDKTAEKKGDDVKEKKEEKAESKKEEKAESKKEETKPTLLSKEVLDRFKTVNIFNFREENEEEYYNLVSQVLQYYEEELITAHISKTFGLGEVNEAIDFIKGKVCTGKVLIKIKDD